MKKEPRSARWNVLGVNSEGLGLARDSRDPHRIPYHRRIPLPARADEEGKAAMNWREHVRVIALLANILLALFLIGTRGWFWSIGFGVPLILPPLLAIVALSVNRRQQ